ncbi:MAG: type II toxin-antitoxin system RelE/ParE family toxin [Rhodospirillales bacterium]|nr:type II toxin-antitoxin system RelE/ParE family toxin [Rhodospirillales bacterium]
MIKLKATAVFAKRAERILGETGRQALFSFIMENPEAGDVVAGTGGVRKLRWQMPGQGKRGGARVLHLYLKHQNTIWMLDIYSKRDKLDLSPEDVRAVKQLVNAIKDMPE